MTLYLIIVGIQITFMSIWIIKRNKPIKKRAVTSIIIFSLIVLSLELFFSEYNFTNITPDSLYVLKMSQVIAKTGFTNLRWDSMASFGYFIGMMQAAAKLINVDYLYILQPMFSMSFIFLFGYILYELSEDYGSTLVRVLFSFAATLFLFSSTIMRFEFSYIHSNLITAIFLFLLIICYIFWEKTTDQSWLIYAILSGLGFSLTRTENPITLLIFVTLFLGISRSKYAQRVRYIAPMIGLVAFFEAILLFIDSPHVKEMINPSMVFVFVVLLSFYLVFLLISKFDIIEKWIFPHLHKILTFFSLTVLFCAIVIKTNHMVVSSITLFSSAVLQGGWTTCWLIVIPLLAIFSFRKANTDPSFTLLQFGIPLYFIAILIMSFIDGHPYTNPRWSSSPNRMFTQILPLGLLLITLTLGKIKPKNIS